MANEQKWQEAIRTYAIQIDNHTLVATLGSNPFDNEVGFGLELADKNGINIAQVGYFNKNGQEEFSESKGKELLKYRGLIVEAEGLPEDIKNGLVYLLRKIEEI